MHVKNKPPVLVPYDYFWEMADMSKAALMDMVWSLAGQTVESADDPELVIGKIRSEHDTVRIYRHDPPLRPRTPVDYAALKEKTIEE